MDRWFTKVLLVAMVAGCREPEVHVSDVLIVGPCTLPEESQINIAMAELFRGNPDSPELMDCGRCKESVGRCEVVQQACRCGPLVPASSDSLYKMLGNASPEAIVFAAVDPSFHYCVRVLGIFDPTTTYDSLEDCPCSAEPMARRTGGRVCGESTARAPGQADQNLVIQNALCAGDDDFVQCARNAGEPIFP